MAKVAINGFGRIGRFLLRAAWEWPELELTHVNEVKGGSVAAAHLLKFDSVYGHWAPEVESVEGDRIHINGKSVSFSEYATPGEVSWDDLSVDIVLEWSGKFRTPELLEAYFKRSV